MAYFILATQSCRGSIWDVNEKQSRKFVEPILHFLILFGLFEFLMLISIIGLVLYENEYHLDFTFQDVVRGVEDCFYNDEEMSKKCNKMDDYKINQIVLGLMIFQLILFLLNCFIKLLQFTKFILYVGKFVKKWTNRICCKRSCCKGKTFLLEDAGALFNAIFPHGSFVPSDGIAGLAYIHAETKKARENLQTSFNNNLGNICVLPNLLYNYTGMISDFS